MLKKRYHQTGIRIEDDLYQKLRVQAHEDWRTLSAQINISLRQGMEKTTMDKLYELIQANHAEVVKLLALKRP